MGKFIETIDFVHAATYVLTYLRGRNSLVKLVYKFESVPFDQIQYSDPFNPIGRQWWKINRL